MKWTIATVALVAGVIVAAIWWFRKGTLTATAAAAAAGTAPAGATSTTAQNINAVTGLAKTIGGALTGLLGGSTSTDPGAVTDPTGVSL